MVLQKKDFIEIQFTGRLKENQEIFDSNIKEYLAKANLTQEPKPFIFSLGQGMFLQGIDDFLVGKPEIPSNYKIELPPEKAFGPRLSQLIQLMPIKVFQQQKVYPVPGAMFNFDGRIGKILSVSGGRVRVDFNNPISGKSVIYDVKVLRKISDQNEKVKSFINFLFRRDLKFEIISDKIIIEVEKKMAEFIKLFDGKFKELFGVGLEVKEISNAEKKIENALGKETTNQFKEVPKESLSAN